MREVIPFPRDGPTAQFTGTALSPAQFLNVGPKLRGGPQDSLKQACFPQTL
jgi:hypothetical protein